MTDTTTTTTRTRKTPTKPTREEAILARVDNPTVTLIRSIYDAWDAIAANEPDLPTVTVTMAKGSAKGAQTLGHFHADRWQTKDGDTRTAELFIGGEGLRDGAENLMTTLLHEAAHGLGHVRQIP